VIFPNSTLAAAFALAVMAGPALAQSDPEYGLAIIRVEVTTADLDLSSRAGADHLIKRLRIAAGRACGGRPTVSVDMLLKLQSRDGCQAASIQAAVAQVDSAEFRQRFAEVRSQRKLRIGAR
jgi:UrcA family protein